MLIGRLGLGAFAFVLHAELYEGSFDEHKPRRHRSLLLTAANDGAQAGQRLQVLKLALNGADKLVFARVLAIGLLDNHFDVEVELIRLAGRVAVNFRLAGIDITEGRKERGCADNIPMPADPGDPPAPFAPFALLDPFAPFELPPKKWTGMMAAEGNQRFIGKASGLGSFTLPQNNRGLHAGLHTHGHAQRRCCAGSLVRQGVHRQRERPSAGFCERTREPYPRTS